MDDVQVSLSVSATSTRQLFALLLNPKTSSAMDATKHVPPLGELLLLLCGTCKWERGLPFFLSLFDHNRQAGMD